MKNKTKMAVCAIMFSLFAIENLYCEGFNKLELKLLASMIFADENLNMAKKIAAGDDSEEFNGVFTFDENWQYIFMRQRDAAANLLTFSETSAVWNAKANKYLKYVIEDAETQQQIGKQFDRLKKRFEESKTEKDRKRSMKKFVSDVQKAGEKAAKKWRDWKIAHKRLKDANNNEEFDKVMKMQDEIKSRNQ